MMDGHQRPNADLLPGAATTLTYGGGKGECGCTIMPPERPYNITIERKLETRVT